MGKDHKGSSLINFQQRSSTEYSCIEYLAKLRWPNGYKCQKCGCENAYQIKVKHRVFQCSECRFQESVTAETLVLRTRTPLVKWFWAAYLLSHDKRGISAKQLSRELDLHSATAWTMLHKLRRVLCDKGAFPLTSVVEVDETYYGGKGGHDSRGRSLSNKNKALIVMVMECKLAKPKKMPGIKKSGFVAGNAKVAVAESVLANGFEPFLKASLAPGTNLLSDGWSAYAPAGKGFQHEPVTQRMPADAGNVLPLVHLQFNNLKSWLNGTFHGVSP
jgi:hypothetical protein